MRIGQGYDVHRLKPGRKMILGGVEIPSDFGPDGHSDADVLLHAVMDSILGALALGDIGKRFPDTDPAYKDISSMELLRRVADMMNKAGMKIDNLDSTIVLQSPKIQGFIPQMRENIAGALGAPLERISVKATTEEGMGFTGTGEGAAAHAVVLLHRR